jgi:hypothetical protein
LRDPGIASYQMIAGIKYLGQQVNNLNTNIITVGKLLEEIKNQNEE